MGANPLFCTHGLRCALVHLSTLWKAKGMSVFVRVVVALELLSFVARGLILWLEDYPRKLIVHREWEAAQCFISAALCFWGFSLLS